VRSQKVAHFCASRHEYQLRSRLVASDHCPSIYRRICKRQASFQAFWQPNVCTRYFEAPPSKLLACVVTIVSAWCPLPIICSPVRNASMDNFALEEQYAEVSYTRVPELPPSMTSTYSGPCFQSSTAPIAAITCMA